MTNADLHERGVQAAMFTLSAQEADEPGHRREIAEDIIDTYLDSFHDGDPVIVVSLVDDALKDLHIRDLDSAYRKVRDHRDRLLEECARLREYLEAIRDGGYAKRLAKEALDDV